MYAFSGDARFFWPENIGNFTHLPSMWDSILNTGVGMPDASTAWITTYLNLTSAITKIGLSWTVVTLVFWLLPAVLLSFFSSFFLFKHFFQNIKYASIAGLIYLFNTYFLLILGGGQFGVAIAFALAPLVFLSFVILGESLKLKIAIITGLILGVQILFDPRILVLTLLLIGLYFVLQMPSYSKRKKLLLLILASFIIAILLHSYWLLPLIFFPTLSIPKAISNLQNISFFSFADFSHAISFLHPNWPENIFGKVYFLQPEFLVLPIIAFSSLFFIKYVKPKGSSLTSQKFVLFCILLGLIGVFFSKGTNPPFGFIYSFLLTRLPGFIAYRDPTKWYLFVAFSYSLLIPFTLLHSEEILNQFIKSRKISINAISLLIPILYLMLTLILLRGIWTNNLFRLSIVPQEYVDLKNFLYGDKTFSRTLWVPQWQRFGFFSSLHPAIGRGELAQNQSDLLKSLADPSLKQKLQNLSVKYIILPFDSQGEIFLNDRKYDEKSYLKTYLALKKVPWLKEVARFGKIVIFILPDSKQHFWLMSGQSKVIFSKNSDTDYLVKLPSVVKGDELIFSETYNNNWVAKNLQTGKLEPSKNINGLNGFSITKNGQNLYKILYKPQQLVGIGLIITSVILVVSLVAIFFL